MGTWTWMKGGWLAAPALLVLACGDSGTATETASASGGQSTGAETSAGTNPTSTSDPSGGTVEATVGSDSNSATMATTVPTTDVSDGTTATTLTTGPGTTATTGPGMTDTGDPQTSSGVVPDTSTGSTGAVDPSAGSTGGSTGEAPPCEPGDGMGMGMVEKSFIWIASYNTNDISKVDTLTMTELARYRTGPAGENPSRTAVSADGRFVVVNNRNTGRSTMIAANEADCIDKNNNGMIDTSQNKNNLLNWDADECVRWSIVHPVAGGTASGPRGVTWTPGEWSYDECKYVNPKVWIGYLAAGNNAHFVRVDGITGMVEQTLIAAGWKGSSYAPYGAALDPQFRPWFSSLRGEFVRVNTDENPATLTRITPPNNVQSYGFTIDEDGNPWFGGCSGPVTVYDQKNQNFTTIVGTQACHRGVTADAKYVWVASNGPCGLVQIDRENRTLIKFHNTNPCSTAIGLSIDVEKNVWLVDQGGFAWKFDPENVPAMQKVVVAGSHYVYSDMTGGQLLSVLPQ
ncbi:lyase [Nannocystis sp.]|uniref:lyase n=1 Tax=Nannocystis sp. TaxID=1962667 RepID=UPI002427C80C|nr:lyase [Nannocystis sp.]MBK7825814.1 lyase [Nannocystis sp.]MBK9755647.1 lyase [Nannocystis sp.]